MKTPIYLDTAATGLISAETRKAGNVYDALLSHNTSAAFHYYLENDAEDVKRIVSDFLGAPPENCAFAPNFSYVFALVLASLKGKKNVLLFSGDYPSLTLPFSSQNFSIYTCSIPSNFKLDYARVEQQIIAQKIEILAISHVQYATGFKADLQLLGAICKRHNVVFLVDGTQSFGALQIPLFETAIDVFIASNYKWMNAGFGSAVAYFADGFLAKFPPLIGGYGSYHVQGEKRFFKGDAKAYEPGHFDYRIYLQLAQAIREKLAVGLDKIEAHNAELTNYFLANFTSSKIELIGPRTYKNRSSILVFRADEKLYNYLISNNVKATFRNQTLRISFHFTNTQKDVVQIVTLFNNYTP